MGIILCITWLQYILHQLTRWRIKSLSYTQNAVCQIHPTWIRGLGRVHFGNWLGQRSIGYRKAIPISNGTQCGVVAGKGNPNAKKQFRGFPPIDFSPPSNTTHWITRETLWFTGFRPKSSIFSFYGRFSIW